MTQKEDQPTTEWNPEPFPEPRTMPTGWHGEALSAKKAAPKEAPVKDWKPEPFPEPRGLPWRKD